MAHTFWTYIANFPPSAKYVEEFNDPHMDVMRTLEKDYDYYSDDFKRKGVFHVFYDDGTYAKIYASEIWELAPT